MLRRSHEPFTPHSSKHGDITGKQLSKCRAAGIQRHSDLAARAQWEMQHRDKLWMLQACELYDGAGHSGVYDAMEKAIGCKTAPRWNAVPWVLLLNTGSIVQVYSDGSAFLSLGTGTVDAASKAVQVLRSRFGAQEISKGEYRALQNESRRVHYGIPSFAAHGQLAGRDFRSGGKSVR